MTGIYHDGNIHVKEFSENFSCVPGLHTKKPIRNDRMDKSCMEY
ncbi:hypothetical protein HMPREF9374_1003 [Desmospora sp. 8437]|nr:hypothetical protein HMPREF9374_1003 [Desmospora sp. 8437]